MAAVAHACVLNKPFAVFNSSLFSLENSNINQEKRSKTNIPSSLFSLPFELFHIPTHSHVSNL